MLENPQAIRMPSFNGFEITLVKMDPLVVPLLVSRAVRTQLL